MIYLFHGEHTARSRQALLDLKHTLKEKELRELDGKQLDENSLTQALSSNSLFEEEKIVIIERLFGGLGKKVKQAETFLSILLGHENTTIILWEEKEVAKTIVTKLGSKAKVQLFSYPVLIFQLIDTFSPAAASLWIKKYAEVIQQEPPEVVHVLLVRRIRQLLLLKARASLVGVPPWQISRLTNQARLFTMEQLLESYQSFLKLELANKTGTGILSLPEATEYLVATLY